jgi:hypothetical protein
MSVDTSAGAYLSGAKFPCPLQGQRVAMQRVAVDYGAKEDGLATLPSNVPVTVWVYQLPNEDWAIYFAKRSPMPASFRRTEVSYSAL